MDAKERNVVYHLPCTGGRVPFRDWFEAIRDRTVRLAVAARVARMRGGNFSDSSPIGTGASENRLHVSPGYRIYYGLGGMRIVLLLGGDKSSQASDIKKALAFWQDYRERKHNETKRKL